MDKSATPVAAFTVLALLGVFSAENPFALPHRVAMRMSPTATPIPCYSPPLTAAQAAANHAWDDCNLQGRCAPPPPFVPCTPPPPSPPPVPA